MYFVKMFALDFLPCFIDSYYFVLMKCFVMQELEAEADQCAVCIEPYKWNDVIRVLPCK